MTTVFNEFRADPRELDGKVAIVTGGGQGLGRAFAKAFASVGARVVIAELNVEKADAVVAEIRADGGEAVAVRTDVADVVSTEEMARAAEAAFGRIDILVNNAAIFSTLKMRPFDQIPLEEWDAVLRVNITGVMLASKAVLPAMRRGKWGRIINLSSAAVNVGRANYLHYTTSKAAVIGLTRSMAREIGPDGITVNSILPGATHTEVPRETVSQAVIDHVLASRCIQRAERPDDLVAAVLFLSSNGAEFLTGQSITIDGGMTHL